MWGIGESKPVLRVSLLLSTTTPNQLLSQERQRGFLCTAWLPPEQGRGDRKGIFLQKAIACVPPPLHGRGGRQWRWLGTRSERRNPKGKARAQGLWKQQLFLAPWTSGGPAVSLEAPGQTPLPEVPPAQKRKLPCPEPPCPWSSPLAGSRRHPPRPLGDGCAQVDMSRRCSWCWAVRPVSGGGAHPACPHPAYPHPSQKAAAGAQGQWAFRPLSRAQGNPQVVCVRGTVALVGVGPLGDCLLRNKKGSLQPAFSHSQRVPESVGLSSGSQGLLSCSSPKRS